MFVIDLNLVYLLLLCLIGRKYSTAYPYGMFDWSTADYIWTVIPVNESDYFHKVESCTYKLKCLVTYIGQKSKELRLWRSEKGRGSPDCDYEISFLNTTSERYDIVFHFMVHQYGCRLFEKSVKGGSTFDIYAYNSKSLTYCQYIDFQNNEYNVQCRFPCSSVPCVSDTIPAHDCVHLTMILGYEHYEAYSDALAVWGNGHEPRGYVLVDDVTYCAQIKEDIPNTTEPYKESNDVSNEEDISVWLPDSVRWISGRWMTEEMLLQLDPHLTTLALNPALEEAKSSRTDTTPQFSVSLSEASSTHTETDRNITLSLWLESIGIPPIDSNSIQNLLIQHGFMSLNFLIHSEIDKQTLLSSGVKEGYVGEILHRLEVLREREKLVGRSLGAFSTVANIIGRTDEQTVQSQYLSLMEYLMKAGGSSAYSYRKENPLYALIDYTRFHISSPHFYCNVSTLSPEHLADAFVFIPLSQHQSTAEYITSNTYEDDKHSILANKWKYLLVGASHMRYNFDAIIAYTLGESLLQPLGRKHSDVTIGKFSYDSATFIRDHVLLLESLCSIESDPLMFMIHTGHWDLSFNGLGYTMRTNSTGGAKHMIRVMDRIFSGQLSCPGVRHIVWITAVPHPMCYDEKSNCERDRGHRSNAVIKALNTMYVRSILASYASYPEAKERIRLTIIDAFNIVAPRLLFNEDNEVTCLNHFLCRVNPYASSHTNRSHHIRHGTHHHIASKVDHYKENSRSRRLEGDQQQMVYTPGGAAVLQTMLHVMNQPDP